MKLNKIPDVGVSYGDKIFHLLAYALFSFLWINTFLQAFKTKKDRQFEIFDSPGTVSGKESAFVITSASRIAEYASVFR